MISFEEKLFNIIIFFSYVLLIATSINISIFDSQKITLFQTYFRLYICISLLIRFNPITKRKFDQLDRKIAFSSGLILITSTILEEYTFTFMHLVKKILRK